MVCTFPLTTCTISYYNILSLRHWPEIKKLIECDSAYDFSDTKTLVANEPVNDSSGPEILNDPAPGTSNRKGKSKSKKQSHPDSGSETERPDTRMHIVLTESLEVMQNRTRISERELEIARRKEAREMASQ
jgi:hypothetical protein